MYSKPTVTSYVNQAGWLFPGFQTRNWAEDDESRVTDGSYTEPPDKKSSVRTDNSD